MFQDETIETLNETITEQWRKIDALKRQIQSLSERLQEAEAKRPAAQRTAAALLRAKDRNLRRTNARRTGSRASAPPIWPSSPVAALVLGGVERAVGGLDQGGRARRSLDARTAHRAAQACGNHSRREIQLVGDADPAARGGPFPPCGRSRRHRCSATATRTPRRHSGPRDRRRARPPRPGLRAPHAGSRRRRDGRTHRYRP